MLLRNWGQWYVAGSCFLTVLDGQMVWVVLVIFCPIIFGFPSYQGREVVRTCGKEGGKEERGEEPGDPLLQPPHRIRTCKLLDLEKIALSRFRQLRFRAESKIYEIFSLYRVVRWFNPYRILKWNAWILLYWSKCLKEQIKLKSQYYKLWFT